jgi:cephalosporin-C deacetylase-like acetyl esterase
MNRPQNSPSRNFDLNRREVMSGLAACLALNGIATDSTALAADPSRPRAPKDARLGPLRDLNSYFPFSPPDSVDEWNARAKKVREQILVSCGLWPMPPRPEIEATVHGDVQRDGFSVQRVYFESAPGLYVTGSLFKPDGDGPFPAILCPHGHWANGRFYDAGGDKVKQEIAAGAEKFPQGGRYPLQARCVQLARMGCIVFHYDMIGYADSAPLTFDVAHRFAKQRPELSAPHRFGMFSAQSELRLINVMGLQTWNSIRTVDWLSQRADVDKDRIGVTGASGGGTQTFMLAAVDDRPAAAFPAVMVSTAMQGGCTCENASYFRTRTGNIEIAALCAPRPLGLTAANDWTVDLEKKGLPELRKLYSLLGVSDKIEGKYYPFPHNYNAVSRAMMFKFFNKHFELGVEEIVEQDYKPLSRDELTVWNEAHPKPACDTNAEVKTLQMWSAASDKQLADAAPKDKSTADAYDLIVRTGLAAMTGREMPEGKFSVEKIPTTAARGPYVHDYGWLTAEGMDVEIPLLSLEAEKSNDKVTLWVDGAGKNEVAFAGEVLAHVKPLLDAGHRVVSCDVLHTGWYLGNDKPPTQTRRVNNTREFAGYTLGYNDPLFAQRVQDIMTVVGYIHSTKPKAIQVVGVNGAGPWVACAAALCPEVSHVCIDSESFRFGGVTDIRDPMFLPGAVKYGDLPGILSIIAPRRLQLAGEGGKVPQQITASYRARGAAAHRRSTAATGDAAQKEFVKSLL